MPRRRPARLLWTLIRGALATLGLLVVIVSATSLTCSWARTYAGAWNDPTGDVLVVLAGDMLDVDVIGRTSYWRTVYAVLADRQSPFRRIVFSGGSDSKGLPGPSEMMRAFAQAHGVDEARIEIETASRSTRENAIEVARLLQDEVGRSRIVLLTSDYHMLRARRAFEKAGLPVLPRPFPDALKRCGGPSQRWSVFLDLAGETAKIGYYWAKGWI